MVDLGYVYGTADRIAPIVQAVLRVRAAEGLVLHRDRIKIFIANVVKARSVKIVSTGFDGEVGDRGLAAVVLGRDSARL